MISAWLLYDSPRLEKNRWLAHHLLELAPQYGFEMQLKLAEELRDGLPCEGLPELVIQRCDDLSLKQQLIDASVAVSNPIDVSQVATDKYETYLFARRHGIPVMPTARVDEAPAGIEAAVASENMVLKPIDGHGGAGVQLVSSISQARDIAQAEGGRWILQQLSDEPGIDMRVYVLGGKVLTTVVRRSGSRQEFRSNFTLGGRIALVDPPAEARHIVGVVCDNLSCDFVGVDLIRHRGEWVLGEIEDCVGFRSVYELSERDLAAEYLELLRERWAG